MYHLCQATLMVTMEFHLKSWSVLFITRVEKLVIMYAAFLIYFSETSDQVVQGA